MHNNIPYQLQELIAIPEETINSLFIEVTFDRSAIEEIFLQWSHQEPCPISENDFHFYFVKFGQDGNISLIEFVDKLKPLVSYYCMPRGTINKYSPEELFDKSRLKFKHDTVRSGEPGELILYSFLEGVLLAPKIIAKMNLKTNPEMSVHGSDGIHLGNDGQELVIYFGESKLHQNRRSGIRDALDSTKSFITDILPSGVTMEEFEVKVLLPSNIDVDGPLRDKILDFLDPYIEEDTFLRRYVCFVGYNETFDTRNLYTSDKAYLEAIHLNLVKNAIQGVIELLQDDVLCNLDWVFFFVPFKSVQEFRDLFIQRVVDNNP